MYIQLVIPRKSVLVFTTLKKKKKKKFQSSFSINGGIQNSKVV